MNLYAVTVNYFDGYGDIELVWANSSNEARDAVITKHLNDPNEAIDRSDNITEVELMNFENGIATIYDPRF